MPATARVGDHHRGHATDGGHLVPGAPVVPIGPHPPAAALRDAARCGLPVVEKRARPTSEGRE